MLASSFLDTCRQEKLKVPEGIPPKSISTLKRSACIIARLEPSVQDLKSQPSGTGQISVTFFLVWFFTGGVNAYFAAYARCTDPHVAQTGTISRLRAGWGAGAHNPEKRRQARLNSDFKAK